ncbi:hypothetical protein [Naasia sp. SYSU D00057]|uniref:hypothetical protein n=1 Tax=Naasia sp. SYSU D00057 TaxID=2817380 RepID=UPI001B307220|nr:hypothetical protein [Naasia sp. SYSU D00057]
MTTLEEHAAADRAWGDTEPIPQEWRSGPWSLEVRGDELADLRFDGALVLRMVRAVARDRNWSTVPPEVLSATATDEELVLELRLHGYGADLRGALRVTAVGGGLRIAFDARSGTDFLRNRVGLVVLHPPSVAGRPMTVVTPDGDRTEGAFPTSISPHQPAFDIAGLQWTDGGVWSTLDFEGDVFEMEDQRNWTDASFKTYSTPLALPFPVLLAEGEEVHQAITLTARRSEAREPGGDPDAVTLEETGRSMPTIGVGASTAPDPAPELPRPDADSLLVELVLATPTWRAALDRAVADSRGVPLDVRVVAQAGDDLGELVGALEGIEPARIGIYDRATHVSEPALVEALRSALGSRRVPVVGGARSHFTELNRNHERLDDGLEEITYSVTPQMHATERSQLVESIAMQRLVALDAVRIAAGRPVQVGPITLKARFNAVATTAPPAGGNDLSEGYGAELFDATDPRQRSSALAAWTIASAAASSVPGVAGITYFEQWGPRGIVDADGAPYPVAQAIAWLHELTGHPMLAAADPGRGGVWALGAHTDEGTVVLVANLTARLRRVTLTLPDGGEHVQELGPLEASRLVVR